MYFFLQYIIMELNILLTIRILLFMKKILIALNALIFSLPLFANKVSHSSAENSISFSAFTNQYDYYLDALHYNDYENSVVQGFFGYDKNFLNIGGTATLFGVYLGVDYDQQISNYRDWPANMTDEEIAFIFGFPHDFAVAGHYYDFCYTDGKGIIEAGLEAGKCFELPSDKKLRVSFAGNYLMNFRASLDIAYYQPNGELRFEYGRDADNGIGVKYMLMGTFDDAYKKACLWYHKITLYYGLTHDFSSNFTFGFKPQFYAAVNSFYPAYKNYGVNGEQYVDCQTHSGDIEAEIIVPFAFRYALDSFEQVHFLTTVMVGAFYSTFDHTEHIVHSDSIGLNSFNDAGCVPYAGLGLGVEIALNKHFNMALGSRFVRVPEKDNEDEGRYNAKNMSFSSIASEPLSISIIFK